MRLLDRYLLRELLIPLGYCLVGLMLFWVTADLCAKLREFQEKKLAAGEIARFYLLTAPEKVVLLLPVALLLALLYALTNHARHNEVTAMRAAGISLWRLCLSYLAVGFVATIGVFIINEALAPNCSEAAEQILLRHEQGPLRHGGPGPADNCFRPLLGGQSRLLARAGPSPLGPGAAGPR